MSWPLPSPPELFRAAALRHRQLRRSPGYLGGPDALDMHVAKLMGAMTRGGGAAVRVEGEEATAMVACLPGELVPGAQPVTYVVAHQADEVDAAAWVAEQVDAAGLPDNAYVTLLAADQNLREVFEARGFGVSSVSLSGRADVALSKLVALPQSACKVGELVPGARLRALLPGDIEGVVALYAEVFGAEPQYCPFGTEPSYHAALRRRHASDEPGFHFVVEVGGEVRGVLGGWLRADVHTPPSSLGMDLLLGQELRGKGLSWVAYRRILERGFPNGAAWIKGTTGQPGVMRAARAMGRSTVGLNLTRSAAFPAGWFDAALTPEALGFSST